jgi:ketosteroid isomerase-like protein
VNARAVVEEHIAAFNAHDASRLLAGLAPDAVWITGSDTVAGRAALADLFDDWLWSTSPSLSAVSIVAEGDRVAAQLREVMTVDGRRREFTIAVFFEVADGLITRAKVYREGSADL